MTLRERQVPIFRDGTMSSRCADHLGGAMGNIGNTAHHLGEIRQMLRG